MTDYRREEFETDRLADAVAREKPRVTSFPDQPNDIPLDKAISEMQRINAEIHQMDDCECLQQGATPCGACGMPPRWRE